MYTPPLLGRSIVLHQQELRAEVARGRRAHTAVVGTRMRGGIFLLSLRSVRIERRHPQPLQPRPAPA